MDSDQLQNTAIVDLELGFCDLKLSTGQACQHEPAPHEARTGSDSFSRISVESPGHSLGRPGVG